MRGSLRTDILLSPLFLLGLTVLVVNDSVLKYEFSNGLTGKLSDFSGLFVFPLFFSAFFPDRTKPIYFSTVVIFSYWNSWLSQGLIDLANSVGIHIGRTIDTTDFLALVVLPFSYLYFKSQASRPKLKLMHSAKAVASALAIFSFIATTLPRQEAELAIKSGKTFIVDISKREFFSRLKPGYGRSDTLEVNLADSLFYLHYYVPDIKSDMFVLASIKEADSKTIIRLDSILIGSITGGLFSGVDEDEIKTLEEVEHAKHESYFEKYFIGGLTGSAGEPSSLFYDNKRIYDELQGQFH